MRKYIRKVKWNIKSIIRFFKLFIEVLSSKEKVFILATPKHGNLGDQAIALAEYEFLKDIKKDVKIIEIEGDFLRRKRYVKLYKLLIGKKDILIHGGGFIGTLWMEEEIGLRNIVSLFRKNKIIIFPQTIYYENSNSGKNTLEKSLSIFEKHKDLTICVREKYSYEEYKEIFRKNNLIQVPDMVTYLPPLNYIEKKSGVLLCMRNDREKAVDNSIIEELKRYISSYYDNEDIKYTDTVIDEFISIKDRKEEVYSKIKEFSRAKLIVTDRLHGMVFAAIAQTPCIVFGNCNNKVRGIYNWIKNNEYIYFVENTEGLEEVVKRFSQIKECKYDNSIPNIEFDKLKKIIENKY
jgi:pyruvyl transferase EpsI